MKTEHTPEPWRIGRFTGPESYEKVRETCGAMDVVVDTDSGPYVLAGCNINFPNDAKANARRIVACVNACAGLPTEVLERYKLGVIGVDYKSTKQQRDELLAALEQFVTWGRMQHKSQSKGCHATFDMMALKDEIDLAEAAIASAKEK